MPENISVLDLPIRAARPGLKGRVRIVVAGRKTQNVYPIKDDTVSFTPDTKCVVFRSNMLGPTYAFSVEVATSQ
jgi:hypothetical protein